MIIRIAIYGFNSRSREGSDICGAVNIMAPLMFQFALPRGERPLFMGCSLSGLRVSIRAPARGATEGEMLNNDHAAVSIRAPARGATEAWVIQANTDSRFNSRSREGSDQIPVSVVRQRRRFNSRSR